MVLINLKCSFWGSMISLFDDNCQGIGSRGPNIGWHGLVAISRQVSSSRGPNNCILHKINIQGKNNNSITFTLKDIFWR